MWSGQDPDASSRNGPRPSLLWPWPMGMEGAHPGWGPREPPAVSQVHVAVGRSKVRLYVDCRKVAERPIGEAGSLPAAGFVMLGRLAKARGPRSSSASVSQTSWGWWAPPPPVPATPDQPHPSLFSLKFQLQVLQIVCNDSWAEEDRCCELPASVGGQVPTEGKSLGVDKPSRSWPLWKKSRQASWRR